MDKEKTTWERNKKLIILMFAIPIIIAVMFIAGAIIKGKVAEYQEQKAIEAELAEKERLEQERLEKIERALLDSEYEDALRKLYEQYPQMAEMLLNLELYPQELISYLIQKPETVDWVIAYPEYTNKTKEEINTLALASIDLSQHERRGQIPIYYQWDKQWGYTTYGEGYMAITGCAPTCLSMAAVGLTGDTSITPKKVADISDSIGAYVEGVGTSWDLMVRGAQELGLKSWQIDTWSVRAVRSQLEAGKLVICSMGEGDFTTQGHFILLVGVTEDGKFLVNDPNSETNTMKEWDGKVLLDQMKGMWSISI